MQKQLSPNCYGEHKHSKELKGHLRWMDFSFLSNQRDCLKSVRQSETPPPVVNATKVQFVGERNRDYRHASTCQLSSSQKIKQ